MASFSSSDASETTVFCTPGVNVRKPLLDYTLADLQAQFHTPKSCNPACSIGCSRTASAFDQWRAQQLPEECEGEYEARGPASVVELSE